jgi:putative transcriptional regulator
LRTKSFAKITVNDICDTAMVSRSTFYTHFEDKFFLLNTAIDKIIEQLNHETETTDIPTRPMPC